MKRALSWLKANSVMLVNSGSLVGTMIVTSGLGFVYWWVAARRFTPEVVGIGSAAISSMTLLGTFCVLGLGTLLITEIPRQPEKALPLITTSLTVVTIAGGLAGLLFAMIAPLCSKQFSYLNTSVIDIISYAGGVSLTSITLVLDQALIGLLRGFQQFYRNALFATIKLVALITITFLSSNQTGMNVYATWTLGNLLSVVIILVPLLFKSKKPLHSYLPEWKLLRQMGSAAMQHHLLNIMLQFTAYALPTIVTVLLSARMNALFYVSWMMVNFIFYIPAALTVVLHAMNSAHQSTLARRARVTISLALATSVVAAVILQCIAQQVLSVFGRAYIDGASILRILVLAAFPIIIENHYISICRIQDRVKSATWMMALACCLELGAIVIGARLGGLFGLSLGWVIISYVEAICMLPTIYNAVLVTKPSAMHVEESFVDAAAEALWLMDTAMLPAIDTSRLPIIKPINRETELYKKSGQRSSNNSRSLRPLRLQPLTSSSPRQSHLTLRTGPRGQFVKPGFIDAHHKALENGDGITHPSSLSSSDPLVPDRYITR